ncbi:hypothetical protein I0E51_12735 [Pseudomonas lalucatii]|nr:hypothetical protein [Pseudomonas lalucatii]
MLGNGGAYGSVDVSLCAALQRQIKPGKARNAANGRALGKFRNTAWLNLPRNPKAGARFTQAGVTRRSFGTTKLLSSCLALRKASRRRGHNETSTDPTFGFGYTLVVKYGVFAPGVPGALIITGRLCARQPPSQGRKPPCT